MTSTTAYMEFEDDGRDDNISEVDDAILSPILNDENLNDQQRYQFAQVFERTARMLRNAPRHTYIDIDNENYCLPMNKGKIYSELQKRNIPKRVSENIFTITFVWQLICLIGLEGVDALTRHQLDGHDKPYFITGIVVMVIFQMSNLILCLSVTIKLFKQYKHKHTSMKFLLHSYIATLVLFGGMYTFTAWIFPETFSGMRGEKVTSFRALDLYSQLLFLSISTGTLCGAASVVATHVLSEAMMAFQMLLSFLYFASIISEVLNPSGIDNKTDRKAKRLSQEKNKSNEKSSFKKKKKKIRNMLFS